MARINHAAALLCLLSRIGAAWVIDTWMRNSNLSLSSPGQTDVTDTLNGYLTPGGDKGIYNGGRGLIIRNVNDGLTSTVVPCSFIVNDIISVSTMYPDGNPMCPNKGSSGYNKAVACGDDQDAFRRATVGAVMSNFALLFTNGDNIQDSTWGYGVFYGTDANSADQRCLWCADANGYDCPGGWIPWQDKFYPNSDKKGSGNFPSGNQYAGGMGGGSGCHFSIYDKLIDQTDAFVGDQNLVGDQSCQCNYNLKGNWWQDWVNQWMAHASPKKGEEWMGWFGGGKAPMFALDMAACWVNNPRDMIQIQNAMYWYRDSWNNNMEPIGDSTGRRFWGWNEVPLDSKNVNNPVNWDAVMIKLPANLCGNGGFDDKISCLEKDVASAQHLEGSIAWYIANGYLKPGVDNVESRPGSYVVFLKEWYDTGSSHWMRGFYCESWTSIHKKYSIYYDPKSTRDSTGVCFIYDGAPKPKKTCGPRPKQHKGCNCDCSWASVATCRHDDGSCCFYCCCHHHRSSFAEGSNETMALNLV